MKIFGVIIENEAVLDDVLSIIVEAGGMKSLIIEASQLESVLSYDMPIFTGAFSNYGNRNITGKVVVGFVKDDEHMKELISILKEEKELLKEENLIVFSSDIKLDYGNISEL